MAKERQSYLDYLRRSYLEHQEKFPPAAAEVLVKLNNTKDFPPPYCYYRPDIICGGAEKPEIIEINKDQYYSFDPHDFSLPEGVVGVLLPFHWNGIEFRLHGDVKILSEFEGWIHRWMDIDDARYEEGKEFLNVIHNVTVPRKVNDYIEFSLDMGSAEIIAFFELIALFPDMNVTKFEIGSFSMIDTEQRQK